HDFCDDGTVALGWCADVFSPYCHVAVEVQRCANNHSETNLSEYFEPASKSVLVTFFICSTLFLCKSLCTQLEIIINEADYSKPDGADKHQPDVDLTEICKQECRNEYGEDDDDASHCWCTLLALLTCEAEVAHALANLLPAEEPDYPSSPEKRDRKRKQDRNHHAEGDEGEQGAARETDPFFLKPFKKMIEHANY